MRKTASSSRSRAAAAAAAVVGGGNNLEFGLHNLDAVLGMLAAADKGMWRLEHSPKFWDFEAARWIRARDWKGTNNSSK